MDRTDYNQLFEKFNDLNVLIIGDVMIDSYIWGKVDRISPEAPVPVVSVNKRENRLGGAANVALNVNALGANPVLCSVLGDDPKADEFIDLLAKSGMSDKGMIRSSERITTTKFRVIGNRVQMLRVDEEITTLLSEEDEKRLYNRFLDILSEQNINVIIFQDYDKGVITPGIIEKVVAMAGKKSIPVAVDPKKNNFLVYKNVNLFKPNLKELKEGLHIDLSATDTDGLKKAAGQLRSMLNTEIILITLSEEGIFVDYRDGDEKSTHVIPSTVRNVSDVSGAGDTVISVASLCLALHLPAEEIAFISNLAGGLVCERVGVVPVVKDQLLKEILKLRQE